MIAAIIGGLISGAVALLVFQAERRRRRQLADEESKRNSVVGVLDAIDAALRNQALPPAIRDLRAMDASVVLALSRMTLELPRQDWPVTAWALARVRECAWRGGGRNYISGLANVQARLLSWYQGNVPTEWFERELETNPVIESRKAPVSLRAGRLARETGLNVGLLTVGVFVFVVFRELVAPLFSRFARWVAS